MKIYGIKNCDTVKKSLKWLDENNLSYEFFDFKKQEVTNELASEWFKEIPLEQLINKRGTTWRQLEDSQKNFDDVDALKALVVEKPTLVKRPVVNDGSNWFVGFNKDKWAEALL